MTYTAGFADSRHGPILTTMSIIGQRARAFHGAAGLASTAWPVANSAYLLPFAVAVPVTVAEMFFITGTTPGTANFDLGIYREDFTRIASLGATACVNTTNVPMPSGGGAFAAPITLPRGRYYMAMSAAATTVTVMAAAYANGFCRAVGMQSMATAQPLPATVTPASMSTTNFIPYVAMATITNIL